MGVRGRTVICVEGWAFLGVMAFILAGALLREINLLVLIFGLMTGPMLFSRWYVRWALRRVEARRRLPHAASAGDVFAVEIELTSRRRRGVWSLSAQDLIRPAFEHLAAPKARPQVHIPYLRGRGTRRVSYSGQINQRGIYQLGPLRLSCRFPMGLIRRSEEVVANDQLVVFPRLGRLTPRWSKVYRDSLYGSRQSVQVSTNSAGDFHGLRDWRPGDSRRLIHWRTSARHGELMVRQFEAQSGQDVAVVVDLWQPIEPSREDLENVELAVSFAATVMVDACSRGNCQVLLGVAGGQPAIVEGPASSGLQYDLLEQLAAAEAVPDEGIESLLCDALDRLRSNATVVVISTRAINLADEAQYAEVWSDSRRRVWLGRLTTFDTSAPELENYFVVE